ncbi:MAG: radical SAM protein, partial [Nitrospirae bacterium]|nr:radical SAM protein [Nitrospirota bacterium]
SKSGRIVLSVSAFVPKPFTPFQWHPMAAEQVIVKRLKILRDGLKKENVKVHHDQLKNAYTEGLLAMGDRRIALVIESMADGLSWRKACEAHSTDPAHYIFREKSFEEPLPWDFIENGVNKEGLWREYTLSVAAHSG